MEKLRCLVCDREMEANNKIMYIDHFCDKVDDHHFSMRIRENVMHKLRIRFQTGDERLCLKVHYDEGYSEVWTRSNSELRVKIDQIVVPDFTDAEKLKDKIRTILLFS